MDQPTHINPFCCECGHALRPYKDIEPNADPEDWVCGREWDPDEGGGRCDGLYMDYTLEQFQEAFGEEMGLEWWEANKKPDAVA